MTTITYAATDLPAHATVALTAIGCLDAVGDIVTAGPDSFVINWTAADEPGEKADIHRSWLTALIAALAATDPEMARSVFQCTTHPATWFAGNTHWLAQSARQILAELGGIDTSASGRVRSLMRSSNALIAIINRHGLRPFFLEIREPLLNYGCLLPRPIEEIWPLVRPLARIDLIMLDFLVRKRHRSGRLRSAMPQTTRLPLPADTTRCSTVMPPSPSP